MKEGWRGWEGNEGGGKEGRDGAGVAVKGECGKKKMLGRTRS